MVNLIIGITVTAALVGLFCVYVLPNIWKPKQ